MVGRPAYDAPVLDVFTAMLLAIAVLLLVCVAWVVAVRRDRPPAHTGVSSSSAAIIGVAFAAVAAAAGAFVVSLGLRLGTVGSLIGAIAVGLSVLVWWHRGRVWIGRAVVAWALAVDATVVGLACAVAWLVTSDLPAPWVVAGLALCLVEAVVLIAGLRHVQVFLDDYARRVRPAASASTRPRLGVPLLVVAATATALALFGLPVVAPADSGSAASPTASKAIGVASRTAPPAPTHESSKPDRADPSDSAAPPRPTQPRDAEASQEPMSESTTEPTSEPTTEPTTEPSETPKGHPTGPPDGHPTHPPHGGGNDN
jgi:hypothetical protein